MTSANQTIRFCVKCDNKYYHKIEDDVLIYFCRVCGNKDTNITSEGLCVLNTEYHKNSDAFEYVINRFTKYDPTLPHIYLKCPNEKCSTNEDKQVTDVIYLRYDKDSMKHIYMCTTCNNSWKTDNL